MGIQLRPFSQQIADLQQVVSLGASVLTEVKTKLAVASPTLGPGTLRKAISEVVGEQRAEPLVRQLLWLRGIVRQSGESISNVIKALGDAVVTRSGDNDIDGDQWEAVMAPLQSLVDDKCVRLAATAIELSYDYANLLRRTKVLTDVRPIFNDAGDGIDGAVVSFTMRLRYSNADGEHDLSIALDENDIKTLQEQCQRAILKARTASAMMVDRCEIAAIVSGEADNV
jgi:hypothetical protein